MERSCNNTLPSDIGDRSRLYFLNLFSDAISQKAFFSGYSVSDTEGGFRLVFCLGYSKTGRVFPRNFNCGMFFHCILTVNTDIIEHPCY